MIHLKTVMLKNKLSILIQLQSTKLKQLYLSHFFNLNKRNIFLIYKIMALIFFLKLTLKKFLFDFYTNVSQVLISNL